MTYLLMFLLLFTAFFLIVLVLVQRGKGGGLAGAFGGMGGQSAFGTKAGDLFTRITIGVAAFWIILCVVSVKLLSTSEDMLDTMGSGAPVEEGLLSGETAGQEPLDGAGGTSGTSGAPASSDKKGE